MSQKHINEHRNKKTNTGVVTRDTRDIFLVLHRKKKTHNTQTNTGFPALAHHVTTTFPIDTETKQNTVFALHMNARGE